MASQLIFCTSSRLASFRNVPILPSVLRSFSLFLTLIICSMSAHAQFQQPLVFSSGGAVLVRNDQTGVLTPTSGSPFAATGQTLTLDVKGRFLFGLGNNSIDMYQITDPNTGAYSKVPTSPFASPHTNQPMFIAVEPTGQYLAVINRVGQNPGESSIETFQIDPANLALVPVTLAGSFLELDSTVIGASADRKNRQFYVFLGPNDLSSNQQLHLNSELNTYAIDSQTGLVRGTTFQPGNIGRCFAMDPQGRFLSIGQGENEGQVGIFLIAPASGLLVGPGAITLLAPQVFPIELFIDVTGNFLYLTDSLGPAPPVHIFAIDPLTQALTETASSPLPGFTSVPTFMGDPTGPFMYSLVGTSIQAYMTDPQTGYFTPVPGTAISAPGVNGSFVFSIPPGQQNLVGPVATLTPASLSLGSLTVGTPSSAQSITLTSTGDQALSLSSISIIGANASEFSESDTCQAPTVLQPSKSCTISVIFTPSATGQRQATLMTFDNAPGSPQPVQLSGVGVAPPPPKPAVTLIPGNLSFPTITQGTSAGPLTVTVTNSGNATLHIMSVAVGGNNANDFSSTNNCVGAFAANTGCTINVTFAPLAAGLRSETITLTDDAPDSPQVINVSGNANPAFSVTAAAGSSTSASISAGQAAQYQMLMTPGAGYTGAVSLACSGAPLFAICQLSASLSITNGVTAPFTVTVKTSGSAILPPSIPLRFPPPTRLRPFPMLMFVLVLLACLESQRLFENAVRTKRLVFSGAFTVIVFCAVLSQAGCGGGSAAVTPPPNITPTGTSTILITPTAMSSSGKALQLQPIQLTLTVK
jgi:hypothetical protein